MSDKFTGWIQKVGTITLHDVINDLGDNPASGAITTFTGIVRKDSDHSDLDVIGLEVEAWEKKSTEAMTEIAEKIGNKHDLLGLRIVHLEGKIKIGQPIVFVVISSAHRKEAFEALEDCINAYKQDSPVWKKEIYEDGTGNWITTAK